MRPPLFGQWVDPRLQQPWTRQTNAGWSHELMPNTIVNVDYVRSIGGDLNFRPRVNQRIAGTQHPPARGAGAHAQPERQQHTRRRSAAGAASTTRSSCQAAVACPTGSTSRRPTRCRRARARSATPTDELNTANIQDPNNPFDDPRQFGPNLTTDARHRFTASAIWQAPWGITVAPFFLFRSALPVYLIDGRDLNLDGDIIDIPTTAYRVTGYDPDTHTATIEAVGDCKTVNCGRSLAQSQFNLRVSKSFPLGGRMRVEAIGDVFNLFNALNPGYSTTTTNRRRDQPDHRRGRPDAAPAELVLGRRPASRAACRPDRVPVLVLMGLTL